MQLLVLTLIQLYNEKYPARQEKIQHEQFEKKKSTRKLKFGAQACAERDKETLIAKWGKRSGALRARSHPASLQCLEKGPEIFLVLKKATNQSLYKM